MQLTYSRTHLTPTAVYTMVPCMTSICLFVLQQHLVSGQQCSTVGRVGNTMTGNNEAQSEFYIDRHNRAKCAGIIKSISYCFHRPPLDIPIANEYLATIAVYTPESSGANEVNFVRSSSPIVIRKSATELLSELHLAQDPNFACSVLFLSQPVPVKPDDVLGACLFDPLDSNGIVRYRLDLVSRATLKSENIVRTNTRLSNPAGCTATRMPNSFHLGDSGTTQSSSRSVHLWGNVVYAFYDKSTSPNSNSDFYEDKPLTPTTNKPESSTTNHGANYNSTTALPTESSTSNLTINIAAVAAVAVGLIVLVTIVLVIAKLSKSRKRKLSSSICSGQYSTPTEQAHQNVVNEEESVCYTNFNRDIHMNNNKVYGIFTRETETNTTMLPEVINTSLNASYNVTNRSCENVCSDYNYYSVIPSVYQEDEISGITPI